VQTRPLSGPARVLVVDQPLIAEVIKLTLNHGVYVTREAKDAPGATALLDQWRPHLAGERLAQAALHRHRAGQGLPLHPDVLRPGPRVVVGPSCRRLKGSSPTSERAADPVTISEQVAGTSALAALPSLHG
jgi:hypothetical protein